MENRLQSLNPDNLQWQVERYVLGDETLDLESFEQQMLEDPELALAVSHAVEQLASISAAVQHNTPVRSLASKPRNTLQMVIRVLAGCAAVVLLAFLATRLPQDTPSTAARTPAEEEKLSVVAENWLVLDESELFEVEDYPLDGFDAEFGVEESEDWIEFAAQALIEERNS